jgi:hypothetical protein
MKSVVVVVRFVGLSIVVGPSFFLKLIIETMIIKRDYFLVWQSLVKMTSRNIKTCRQRTRTNE